MITSRSPRTGSLKRHISDSAVHMCAPNLPGPTTIIARAHESYEYRKDRRRTEELFEAYHAPPTVPITRSGRYQSQAKQEGRLSRGNTLLKGRMFGSLKKRRSQSDIDRWKAFDFDMVSENTTTATSGSIQKTDFVSDAGSFSFLLLDDPLSPSQRSDQIVQAPQPWEIVSGTQNDPWVMTEDPLLIRTDDPWALPSLWHGR